MMLKLVTNEMGILMDEQLGTGEVREVRKGKTFVSRSVDLLKIKQRAGILEILDLSHHRIG